MNKTFKSFDDLDFLKDKSKLLKNLSKCGVESMNNMLIFGKNGSGRLTRVRVFLSELFGSDVTKVSNKCIQFKDKDKTKFHFKRSNYHIEIDMKMCSGISESLIYEHFLKNYTQSKNVIFNIPYVFVFRFAELISKKLQNILSVVMDKCYRSSRFIFISDKLFQPKFNSRLVKFQLGDIERDEIKDFLIKHSCEEGTSIEEEQVDEMIDNIYQNELYYNLNDIFFLYELCTLECEYDNFYISHNIFIDDLIKKMFAHNFIYMDLYKIRQGIYDLFTCNYNAKNIVKYIYKYISKHFDYHDEFIMDFVKLTNEINMSMNNCNKEVIHLEKYFTGILKLRYKYNLQRESASPV